MSFSIRTATHEDAPHIHAIYNEVIATTNAIWEESPVTLDFIKSWVGERLDNGYSVFVAEENGQVIGYAGYAKFRARTGYWPSVEHSIHVSEKYRKRGIASALMSELITTARAQNRRVMVAGISGDGEASIALHRKFGFEDVGRVKNAGEKFGKKLDLVFMQKTLD